MCLGSAGVALRMTTHLVLQPLITDQCLTGGGGWGVQAGSILCILVCPPGSRRSSKDVE